MPVPAVRHDPERKQYSVRMDSAGCRIRVLVPDSQISGANDETKQKAALKRAKAIAKDLHDTIQAD